MITQGKKTHIVFLVHDIHLGGGGERVTVNLANAFTQLGYKVSVVSIATAKQQPVFNLDPAVERIYLNIQYRSNLLNKLLSVIALNRFLIGKQFDFVLAMGSHPGLILSLTYTGSKKIRKIGCMHGSFKAIPRLWSILSRMFFGRLDVLVSLTAKDQTVLQGFHRHVVVIPNSATFKNVEQAPLESKTALALGRFSEEKDLATMIRLFGVFYRQKNDWKLVIHGDGPLRNELEELVVSEGLQSGVKILPPVSDVTSVYLQSSVVLLTSKNEGLPMVLIEAQTFGIPVISFDCETGPAEIIHDGVTGFLIDPAHSEKMVERLTELADSVELRKKMGAKAKQYAATFSEETILAKWQLLFQELNTQ